MLKKEPIQPESTFSPGTFFMIRKTADIVQRGIRRQLQTQIPWHFCSTTQTKKLLLPFGELFWEQLILIIYYGRRNRNANRWFILSRACQAGVWHYIAPLAAYPPCSRRSTRYVKVTIFVTGAFDQRWVEFCARTYPRDISWVSFLLLNVLSLSKSIFESNTRDFDQRDKVLYCTSCWETIGEYISSWAQRKRRLLLCSIHSVNVSQPRCPRATIDVVITKGLQKQIVWRLLFALLLFDKVLFMIRWRQNKSRCRIQRARSVRTHATCTTTTLLVKIFSNINVRGRVKQSSLSAECVSPCVIILWGAAKSQWSCNSYISETSQWGSQRPKAATVRPRLQTNVGDEESIRMLQHCCVELRRELIDNLGLDRSSPRSSPPPCTPLLLGPCALAVYYKQPRSVISFCTFPVIFYIFQSSPQLYCSCITSNLHTVDCRSSKASLLY